MLHRVSQVRESDPWRAGRCPSIEGQEPCLGEFNMDIPVKSDSFLRRIEIVECSSLGDEELCVWCDMGILLQTAFPSMDIVLHFRLDAAHRSD